MSETPSLEAVIEAHLSECGCSELYETDALRAAHIAEMWHYNCIVHDADSLDLLPVGSVIRDNEGDVLESYARTKNQANAWMAIGVPCRFLSDEIPLPATLLGLGVSDV